MSKMSRLYVFALLACWVITSISCSSNNDGINDNDCRLLTEELSSGGGYYKAISTYTYDSDGSMLSIEIDSNADGTAEKRLSYSYTFDSNGYMLSKVEVVYEVPSDYLVLTKTYTYTYDSSGNMLTEEVHSLGAPEDADPNPASNLLTRTIYTYDSEGNMLTKEEFINSSYSSNPEGVTNIHTYNYDTNGNVLTEEVDREADGTVNARYTYTYDSDGNMLISELDEEADGTVNARYTYTYDSDGNMLSAEIYDADATLSSSYTYTWSCE